MSDAIREAFEALDNLRKWAEDHPAGIEDDVDVWHSAVMSALQSQTAPAVPGTAYGLHHVSRMYQVMRRHDSTIDDVALDSMRDTLRHVLVTPQPDHYPDAGKVVQGQPVAEVMYDAPAHINWLKGWPKTVFDNGTKLYTHPAESREGIQALESHAADLRAQADQIHRDKTRMSKTEAVQMAYAAKWAEQAAARLRASQKEGAKG